MTLKRKNAVMEHNPAAAATNNFGYYKDPLNYTSPTSAYSDIYQLTYPFEDDVKDKRYQYASATGTTLPQPQPSQSQQHHQPQAVNGVQYAHHHQSYTKADYHQPTASSYKTTDKTQSVINPYANYSYPNYKDSAQYTPTAGYYDQYKFNMGLASAPTTHYGKTGKDTNYHQNYSPGLYADSKLASGGPTYCDDVNLATKSASLVKSTNASQMSQFPMYTNCYGYPAAASFSNQNYCSYAQSCNDDARILWDEYQTNRRLMSSYVSPTSGVPATVSVQTPTVPPIPSQSSCRLKSGYPTTAAEYYGTSAAAAAYHAYHGTDGLRSREKLMYPMNSHVASDSLYTSRSRCLPPMDYKYHQTPMPQNMVMPQYDPRYNYMSSDSQTLDYCAPRQETTAAYHHPAYAKSSLVNTSGQKHIRAPPTASMPNDFCNTQPYYVCNEQMSAAAGYQDAYSQQYLRDTRHAMGYNVGGVPSVRGMPVSNGAIGKEALYAQQMDGAYYTHAQQHGGQVPLAQNPSCAENSKSAHVKGQNLREFLATWNEDEDDGGEKMDDTDGQLYVQQSANFEVEKSCSSENHLQFKGSFNTRPKIHVGITVDSNMASNQYINLPDIIIDIEKPKDTDLISHSIETTQNGNTEKLVLLESVDVPVGDLTQYGGLSLLEPSIEGLSDAPLVAADNGTAFDEQQVPVGNELMRTGTAVGDDAPKQVHDENDNSVELLEPLSVAEPLKSEAKPVDGSCDVDQTSNRPKTPPQPPRCAGKLKRRRRLVKPKPMFEKIIETKSGKLIRIRKVRKGTVKRRNRTIKRKVPAVTSVDLSAKDDEPKKIKHTLYNPKTLKDICICFFNSDLGRNLLMSEILAGPLAGQLDRRLHDDHHHHQKTSASIPKLSALCENALNHFYEEKNILLLNIDDLDSNLFFIECDINENVVSTTHGDDDGESLENGNEFVELFIDDEMGGEMIKDGVDTAAEPLNIQPSDHCPNESLMESDDVADVNDSTCSSSSNALHDSLTEEDICLTSDENSRDFSALHHEEIVPDNLHAFENERLLKHLQNKYIQKSNYLKIFIIDKICKKYRKFILKRRRRRRRRRQLSKTIDRTMTKKVFLAKFRETVTESNR